MSSHTRWGGKSSRRHRTFLPVRGPNAGPVAFFLLSCDSLCSSCQQSKASRQAALRATIRCEHGCNHNNKPQSGNKRFSCCFAARLCCEGERESRRERTPPDWPAPVQGHARVEIHWRRPIRARNSCGQRMPDDTSEDSGDEHTNCYEYHECIPQ